MKVFILRPLGCDTGDRTADQLRHDQITPLILDMVLASLRPEKDSSSLYGRRGDKETSEGPSRAPDEICGGVSLYYPVDYEELRTWIRRSIDPYDSFWCPILSKISCRSVLYGYDGQAMLCLHLEDPHPVSPNAEQIEVEDWSADLHGDFWDGYSLSDE